MAAQSIDLQTNRVFDALLLHTEQESRFRIDNPALHKEDPQQLEHRRRHLVSVLSAYRGQKGLNRNEKGTLAYIRHEIRRMNARQSNNFMVRLLYARPVNWLFNRLRGRQSLYRAHNRSIIGYDKAAILNVNAANLAESLKQRGFETSMEGPLKKHLAHQLPAFSLRYYDVKNPDVDFMLHFLKLAGTDAYYFEGFDVRSRPSINDILSNNQSSESVNFSAIDGVQFTPREAANLIKGRPVLKEIDGEQIWLSQNANSPSGFTKSSFDLSKALADHEMKELRDPAERNKLIKALENGEQRGVTLLLPNGHEESLMMKVSWNANQLVFTRNGQYVDIDNLKRSHARAAELSLQLAQQSTKAQQTRQAIAIS